MPDLSFAIETMDAVLDAQPPFLRAHLRITNSCPSERIESISLRYQVQIEAARRRYSNEEKAALDDLFGSPERWASTMRPLLWANAQTSVPAFTAQTLVHLTLSYSFDLNIAAAKYLEAIRDGEIPLLFLFSGTVFYSSDNHPLQIAQIPWDREARYRLAAKICKEAMELSGTASAWAIFNRSVNDRVRRFRADAALTANGKGGREV
jgi:Family of unknown function (DUF6084)